jgi:hypothetical protein
MAKKKTTRKTTKKKSTRKKRTTKSRRKKPAASRAVHQPEQHAGADAEVLNDAQRPCELSQTRLHFALDRGSEGNVANERKGEAYFHKGLNHSSEGSVNPDQWNEFVASLAELDETGNPTRLASIPFEADNRKWVNPASGWAVDVEKSDSCFHKIPAPPEFNSNEAAAEAIELYWMALLRDLPFARWANDSNVNDAIEELKGQPLFIKRSGNVNNPPTGSNGYVTAPDLDVNRLFRGGELFAGNPARESVGPFLSQFIVQPIPYGTLLVEQKQFYAQPYQDYLIDPIEWRAVQNGEPRDPALNLIGAENGSQRRYITTMRDLATYVHFDQLYEAYLNAALILVQNGYQLGEGNPYGQHCPAFGGIGYGGSATSGQMLSQNQEGFGVFGGAHILSLVTEVATRALKAVWRQKWTHLRLRPEAYGGLIEFRTGMVGSAAQIVRDSVAFNRTQSANSNGLLPMAFPEGSPMHPAYGAGHATVAGACVTILKAFFDEDQPVRDLVTPNVNGQALVSYEGVDAGSMKVGLELDKLASNISIGRNMAGVHWRSDYTQSVLLGQRVAVDMLFRQCRDYIEDYCFMFTTFGGGQVHIGNAGVHYTTPGGSKTLVLSSTDFGHPDRLSREHDAEIAEALLDIV